MAPSLAGKVAIVTGASRGLGKGIALGLAEAGATVYITGRTTQRSKTPEDPETLSVQDAADEIEKMGKGKGIPCAVDHKDDNAVREFFDKVMKEQGKIDILVNNAFGAVNKIMQNQGKRFWEDGMDGEMWNSANDVGLRSHYIASHLAAKHMVKARSGLIVNVSSAAGRGYLFNIPYSTGKAGVDKMMTDMSIELEPYNVGAVTLYPGIVMTEKVDAVIKSDDEAAAASAKKLWAGFFETSLYSGRALAHLAADEKYYMGRTGEILFTARLADRYGFRDEMGRYVPGFHGLRAAFVKMFPSGYTSWWIKLIPNIFASASMMTNNMNAAGRALARKTAAREAKEKSL
eukprot:GFYU01002478.1.p1 GENE.GFYU01002478.1~~GFYU01002478.1.p1  ORF type:complete len:362 (+),score=109.52 GFYU01002478.1:50-1087(+)